MVTMRNYPLSPTFGKYAQRVRDVNYTRKEKSKTALKGQRKRSLYRKYEENHN